VARFGTGHETVSQISQTLVLFCIVMYKMNLRSSFTLIELLIVLAIVAILSVVVILTLNPAELLKQARDSNRLSDLSTLNSALGVFNTDVAGGFMGTSSIVYVSIPDTTSSCANLGLPTLPGGWSYNCATATSTRNTEGTGWIPVNLKLISFGSSLSSLPVDPINTTSSNLYYTYISGGGSWKISATSLESQKYAFRATSDGGSSDTSYEVGSGLTLGSTIFPAGWIKVPGNGTFGTSDFYVMKYEAKCADTSNNLLISPDTGSGYQTYANNTTPCTSGNSRYVTSAAGGYSIANISQTTSITYCQSLGAHLITNNEWQTIGWNAQTNGANWNGGVVGTNYIYSGHNDNVPPSALLASTDDTNGYFGETNIGGNQKRTLTLSNGNAIWDIAGNVAEWTNDTITGTNQPWAAPAGFAWREFTAITSWGTMTQQTAGPANSAWNSTKGLGQIYSDGSANATVYGFIRGGRWADGGGAGGVETLILNTAPANAYVYIGFRCAR
jgi:prepilin-type N-terminal cleavage/methylation domain-containing protein